MRGGGSRRYAEGRGERSVYPSQDPPLLLGRGLTSEIVRTSLDLAFEEIGLPEVVAFTRPENHASRRVLEKSCFTFLRHVAELERDQYLVEIPRSNPVHRGR